MYPKYFLPFNFLTYSNLVHAEIPNGKQFIWFCFPGTTDKIFETKDDVYDAFVDNQKLKLTESLSPLARINNADRKRYQSLCSYK